LNEIKSALLRVPGISAEKTAILDAMLEYAGDNKRASGLFGSGLISQFGKTVKSAIRGVENVYTQHQPVLSTILDSVLKGKLKDSAFPLAVTFAQTRVSEIIVFMIGGTTYEEATKVAEFNTENSNMRVILGGSCVHNSTSFLEEVGVSFGGTNP